MTLPADLCVRVEHDVHKGRYLRSKRKIAAKETIIKVYPFAYAIFENYRKRVCSYCLYYHPASAFTRHCRNCSQIYFCSSACYDAVLGTDSPGANHTRICHALRRLATSTLDRHAKSVINLLLHIFLERQDKLSEARRRKGGKWWENMLFPLPTRICEHNDHSIGENILPASFDMARTLQSHYDEWPSHEREMWVKKQDFLLDLFSSSELLEAHERSMDVLLHWISRIESNGFGLYTQKRQRSGKKAKDPSICFGRALYPQASFFNHDCQPNCECTQSEINDAYRDQLRLEEEEQQALNTLANLSLDNASNDQKTQDKSSEHKHEETQFPYPRGDQGLMEIRALRDIEKGEEVNISYIDTSLVQSTRQEMLLNEYYFACTCNRCLTERDSRKKKGREKK